MLARLRAEQRDPAHGGQAAAIRGAKNAAHQAAVRDWAGEQPDPAVFQAEILPALRDALISDLASPQPGYPSTTARSFDSASGFRTHVTRMSFAGSAFAVRMSGGRNRS